MTKLPRWSRTHRVLQMILAFGCAGVGSGLRSQDYGFMIVGPAGQDQFGLTVGDSLPEVPAATVAREVRSSANAHAGTYQFDRRCTRYFLAGDHFVALLRAGCRKDEVWEDGLGMALLRRDGSDVVRPTPWLSGHYTTLYPKGRDPR